ncbi:MAG: putative bifunctional diguanylate cyclase/phosphodiesterase, partial [Betaproteobacteria bacterium]
CELFGYTMAEMLGLSVHELLPPDFRAMHADMFALFIAGEETERRMGERSELVGYRKNGTVFPLQISIAKFRQGDDWVMVATMNDITERKRADQELVRQATHDPLTGLPNRTLVRERLTIALQRSRRKGTNVAVLFVDLDGFKQINDSYGHDAGDTLLKTIAVRLQEQVRPGDTVGRLAGDEFVVLGELLHEPESICGLAERLNESLRQPVLFSEVPLAVTASIGIAIGHGRTHSADDLLRSADTAMYAVKEKGRDGWQFFSDNLQDQARQRISVTKGLRQAIERKELSLQFQPIFAGTGGRIVGAELLLRWNPPEGHVSPAVFVPIAEMTDSILPIGSWVFEQGCRAEIAWRNRWGDGAPFISLNVSAKQLQGETLAKEFQAILKSTGADPRRILLEIAESALMANIESHADVLQQLTELGLRIAIDDFGTGYSSLPQLARLPISYLKIDHTFISEIEGRSGNPGLIDAFISLGKALGFELVAEGVENDFQLKALHRQGCNLMQGYLLSHPLGENELIEAVNRNLDPACRPGALTD